MNSPASPDGLYAQLIRRGLPADYAQRAAAEIADHHRDLLDGLQTAGMSEPHAAAEALHRIGDARTLVKMTVREYRRRYWCGRWPLLTFLLAPIPMLIVAGFASNLLAICLLWPLCKMGVLGHVDSDGVISGGERLQIYAMQAWYLFALPAIVTWIFARWARRAALDGAWIGVSACVLVLCVVFAESGIPDPVPQMFSMDGSTLPADRYLWRMGIPKSWSELISFTHIQCLLPIAIGAAAVLRNRQLSLRAERFAVDGC